MAGWSCSRAGGVASMSELERFDHYMERVLYGPDGFYTSGRGIAGRGSGDFITSPEVGALFGRVIVNALDAWWDELGQPSTFRVIDAGTGPGTLLTALQHAASNSEVRCSAVWELIGVDRAQGVGREKGLAGSQGVRPAGRSELPEDLSNSVVIANELLDNLVFRVIERQPDGWAELFVKNRCEHLVSPSAVATGLTAYSDVELPSDSDFAPNLHESEPGSVAAESPSDPELSSAIALAANVEVGQRVPVLSAASTWVNDVMARGADRLLVFDYGMATTTELAERGGWLRTYREHQRGDDPLMDPGEWDITTDIAVDQLPTPANVTTQAGWLTQWGIGALVEEGREFWQAHAAAPDLAAMRMRSRIREAEALTDPAGLGSWLALEYRR